MYKEPRYHFFNVCCFEINPKTKTPTGITKENLLNALRHYKSFSKWGLCRHDKDNISADDIKKHLDILRLQYEKSAEKTEGSLDDYIKLNQYLFEGDKKQPHVHIAIYCKNAVTIEQVSKWLNIPTNCIELKFEDKSGKGVFLDLIEYLTHEHPKQQALRKHLYSDDEVVANFDWRGELNEAYSDFEKYGKTLSLKDKLRVQVCMEGLTLKQVRTKYPIEYIEDMDKLKKCRQDYLTNLPMPTARLNIYIGGYDGGTGKGLMGKALAKFIADPDNNMDDDEIYFLVKKDSGFNQYMGQPILIWEDFRPSSLLSFFKNDTGELFKALNPNPTAADGIYRILYGTVKVSNHINIFDSTIFFDNWMQELITLAHSQNPNSTETIEQLQTQYCRRIPLGFWISPEGYSTQINKGVYEATREFTQYLKSETTRGNFQELVSRLGKSEQYDQISRKMLTPAIDTINDLLTRIKGRCEVLTAEELERDYSDWGKPLPLEIPSTSNETLTPISEVSKEKAIINRLHEENTMLYNLLTPEQQQKAEELGYEAPFL